jgi:hypothetical protein
MNKKLVYIATPFTHEDESVRNHRYQTSCRVAAKLLKHGVNVFNPLSHSVPLVPFLGDTDLEFWLSVDLPILSRCDELLILALPNWEKSEGVRAEMFKCLAWRKPITLIEKSDIDLLPKVSKSAKRFLESRICTEVGEDME